MSKLSESGFSLIELIVVISIMAIITIAFVPAYRQFNYQQELVAISQKVIDNLKIVQNRSISGVLSPDGNRSNWFLYASNLSTATSYARGACNTNTFSSCNSQSANEYIVTNLKTGYYLQATSVASPVYIVFDKISGKVSLWDASNNCIGTVVNGVCTSNSVTLKIGSADYTQRCVFITINSQGKISDEQRSCS